jgi:ribosomal protein S18 acetylase RimI-like enzyme
MLELRDASGRDEPWLKGLFSVSQPALVALASLPNGMGEALVTMQYAARQAHFHAHWPQAVQRVIEWRDGIEPGRAPGVQPVGALWADEGSDGIHLLDIAVLPDWRGQGIGTRCLQDLLSAAARRNLPVTLQVAFENPARRLYERLGFVLTGAEDGVNLPMIRRPPSPPARRHGGVVRLAGARVRLHAQVPPPHLTEKCHEQA